MKKPTQNKPTEEQIKIISDAKSGSDLIITARAGTGKTTSLEMVARALSPVRGIYITYNRGIKEEAIRRMPLSLACKTAHSLAFVPYGVKYRHKGFDIRMPGWAVAQILGIQDPYRLSNNTVLSAATIARLAMESIQRFCNSNHPCFMENHVVKSEGLEDTEIHKEVISVVFPFARKAWIDILDPKGKLPFKHDYYLKMFQLSNSIINTDYIMLDEAQDANPVIADIILNQKHCQRIIVGDPAQQLYAWRGAVDAMDNFPGKDLSLTQSFRFGTDIANEANNWLIALEAFPLVRGTPSIKSKICDLEIADAVLCRTNAGAFAYAMGENEKGRNVGIAGGVSDIKALAEAAISLQEGRGTAHRQLFAFKTWDEVREYVDQDKAGQDIKVFVNLIDQYSPEEVLRFSQHVVSEKKADVIVSTVHKAKGLEWHSVKILNDFSITSKNEDDEIKNEKRKMSESEMKVAYVAVTRAKFLLDKGNLSIGSI